MYEKDTTTMMKSAFATVCLGVFGWLVLPTTAATVGVDILQQRDNHYPQLEEREEHLIHSSPHLRTTPQEAPPRRHLTGSSSSSSHTFSMPEFSYRMTIIDRDVKLDDFEAHLVSITTAHLETALARTLDQAGNGNLRVDHVKVTSSFQRAFLGLNSDTGDPEALVNGAFGGSVVVSRHGTTAATTRSAPQEPAAAWYESSTLRDQIHQIVIEALADTNVLFSRFSADATLEIIKEISVHVVEQGKSRDSHDFQQEKTISKLSPSEHFPLMALVLFGASIVILLALVGQRFLGISKNGRSKRARISPTKEALESTAIMEDDEEDGHGDDKDRYYDDNKSDSSGLSSPVFL